MMKRETMKTYFVLSLLYYFSFTISKGVKGESPRGTVLTEQITYCYHFECYVKFGCNIKAIYDTSFGM